jgi:hypothetical protein
MAEAEGDRRPFVDDRRIDPGVVPRIGRQRPRPDELGHVFVVDDVLPVRLVQRPRRFEQPLLVPGGELIAQLLHVPVVVARPGDVMGQKRRLLVRPAVPGGVEIGGGAPVEGRDHAGDRDALVVRHLLEGGQHPVVAGQQLRRATVGRVRVPGAQQVLGRLGDAVDLRQVEKARLVVDLLAHAPVLVVRADLERGPAEGKGQAVEEQRRLGPVARRLGDVMGKELAEVLEVFVDPGPARQVDVGAAAGRRLRHDPAGDLARLDIVADERRTVAAQPLLHRHVPRRPEPIRIAVFRDPLVGRPRDAPVRMATIVVRTIRVARF